MVMIRYGGMMFWRKDDMLNDSEQFKIILGDCIEGMASLPEACMDFSVFSPPFPSVFAYTDSASDLGNSEDLSSGDGNLHLSFFYRQLKRIVKPGRVIMVHVVQIPRMKRVDKKGGLIDFRGMNIRLGERAGLTWEYDWMVRRNPQAQAIRSRSRELQFAGLENDRAASRGTLNDYLLKFRVPGENAVPVCDTADLLNEDGEVVGTESIHDVQVTRNNWIEWAEGCWKGINETDTLNVKGTKGDGDTKHICPLQLPIIDRLVRLYTNPGELVFSPFAGIGSELFTALKLGRRAFGFELKPEYHATAIANCEKALAERTQSVNMDLFAETEA